MPSAGWHSAVFRRCPILSFCDKEFNCEAIPESAIYLSICRGDFHMFTVVRLSKIQRSDAKPMQKQYGLPSRPALPPAALKKGRSKLKPAKKRANWKKNKRAEKQSSAETAALEAEDNAAEESMEKPRDLGPPLVDNPEDLIKLHPVYPVWIDKKNKEVILVGSVCRANYPLEFFATYPDRGYESVVVIYTKPSIVHGALLALGAKPGKPVQYEPKFIPPSGTEVEIDVCLAGSEWKTSKSQGPGVDPRYQNQKTTRCQLGLRGQPVLGRQSDGRKVLSGRSRRFYQRLESAYRAFGCADCKAPRPSNRVYSRVLPSGCLLQALRSR